jgi:hypothetical protein
MQRRKQEAAGIRKRIAAAFRRMARGMDVKTAYARTKDYYRMAGGAWARSLG